jgi:hypothetical protein
MQLTILSGGPHGGELVEFPSDDLGAYKDFPVEKSVRVNRYELRAVLDEYGDETSRVGTYIGAVRP